MQGAEGRGELSPAAPNGCVFIEGTRLGRRALRGLLCPVADLPEGTNKYGQGSPDLELSGSAQQLHAVPRMQLSSFEVLEQVGTGGFGQVRIHNLYLFLTRFCCVCGVLLFLLHAA